MVPDINFLLVCGQAPMLWNDEDKKKKKERKSHVPWGKEKIMIIKYKSKIKALQLCRKLFLNTNYFI